MNPQWNTPPNGDFASYVERLSAQAALPRHEQQEGEHGLDVGMTPSDEPHDAVSDAAAAARRRIQSNGESRPGTPGALGNGAAHSLAKVLAIAWVAGLVLLLTFNAPFGTVVALFVFGVWLAFRLRRWALPPGMATWKQWLEAEARKQRQKSGR
jgi:hypothetical protein